MTRPWQVLTSFEGEIRPSELDAEQVTESVLFLLQELSDHPLPDETAELSILFCDDPFIQRLNAEYREKDSPTDVLSFSQLDGGEQGIPQPLLGDLIISVPTTLRQAEEYGVTSDEELARLLVHGLLHLFGYDHEGVIEEEVKRMQSKENELQSRLQEAGLTRFFPESV